MIIPWAVYMFFFRSSTSLLPFDVAHAPPNATFTVKTIEENLPRHQKILMMYDQDSSGNIDKDEFAALLSDINSLRPKSYKPGDISAAGHSRTDLKTDQKIQQIAKPPTDTSTMINKPPPSPPKPKLHDYMPPPILGPRPVNGTRPMIGAHTGRDAIFALASGYYLELYKFFVGSLRRFGYEDDIVLAVSPKNQIHPEVLKYLIEKKVVGYGFEVDCKGKDSCKLKDNFYGYVSRYIVRKSPCVCILYGNM